jgi:D-citramalate synthase
VLGFVDGDISINWINDAGGKVDNLLCKGSLRHLEKQLRKTPEQHIKEIQGIIRKAETFEMDVNIYLEDWSNGMRNSREYVHYMIQNLKDEKIVRIMLPDTLGVLNPEQTYTFCKKIIDRYPNLHFDFHAHNDYDLGTANALEAVRCGVHGLHLTVNGMGVAIATTCIPFLAVAACIYFFIKGGRNVEK